jgi:sulfate permease, SulP family
MTTHISKKEQIAAWFRSEFSLQDLSKNLNAALLLYMIEAILAISFAALIFSGPLSGGISSAISLILAGNALLVLVISLFSTYSGSIAVSQDTPAVLLALAAASIVPLATVSGDEATIFTTVLVAVIFATLLMGLLFLALGAFRIGRFVRFLPYPVMGGFLAGTGWLLVQGGVGVMTNQPFGPEIFTSSVYAYWLPGMALAAIMLYIVNKIKSAWALPLVCAGGFILFHLIMGLLGVSVADLFSDGWLLGPFSVVTRWEFPLSAGVLSQVDWQVILKFMISAAPLLLICPVAFLLNVSSMELIARKDIDINRELVTTGFGNLASGFAGGIIGFHAISLSSLNQTISKGSRVPGILTAFFLTLTVFVGVYFLSYIPRMVLGSLVVFIGLSLLYDWTIKIWPFYPKIDLFIILSILVTIIFANFLWGILVGMVMTIILFIVSYSKINIIKHSMTGKTKRSRVTRPKHESELLWMVGDQLVIYKLEGFIFFGTAKDLYDRVVQRIKSLDEPEVKFFVLDFTQVSGLDSTGLLNFQKILQVASKHNTQIILTGLTPRLQGQFNKGGYDDNTPGLQFFPDLDHGIEWYEERIIHSTPLEDQKNWKLLDFLLEVSPEEENLTRLIGYMERRTVRAGDYLIRRGEEANEMFLVESGQVTAKIDEDGKEGLRLETMTGGRLVGEVGFFLNSPRTASVVVDQPGVVYSIKREMLRNMRSTDPEAYQTFQDVINHMLSERIAHLTRALDDVQQG